MVITMVLRKVMEAFKPQRLSTKVLDMRNVTGTLKPQRLSTNVLDRMGMKRLGKCDQDYAQFHVQAYPMLFCVCICHQHYVAVITTQIKHANSERFEH